MKFFDHSGLDPRLSESINKEMYEEYVQTQRIEEADIILCGINPLKIEKSWAAKYVICPCTNTNHITLPDPFFRNSRIAIYNLQNVKEKIQNVSATAHHTIYLMLNIIWQQSYRPSINMQFKRPIRPRRSLEGMKLGIVGAGRIGSAVRDIARNLGMDVNWIDKTYETCTKHELLTQSDIISLHTTVKPDMKPILGKEELALVKDGCILINTSRGSAIDEKALLLHIDRLGGVALDVLCGEPDNTIIDTLKRYENVIVTPHLGGYCREDMRKTFKTLYEYFKEGVLNVN